MGCFVAQVPPRGYCPKLVTWEVDLNVPESRAARRMRWRELPDPTFLWVAYNPPRQHALSTLTSKHAYIG